MVYVTSDLHGRKEAFQQLLKQISFTEADEMYLLGDVLDRGSESIPLLVQIMNTKNIHLLLGNHELYALLLLEGTPKREALPEAVRAKLLIEWSLHGGYSTAMQYKALSDETMQQRILQYLMQLSYCKRLNRNGQAFILAHSDMPVLRDSTQSSYWYNLKHIRRIEYQQKYVEDAIFVSGHTPTANINAIYAGKIFRNQYHIDVDCGMQRLGCICLDTFQEYYV